MNYYPFHIGDYVSATRHLSWEEDAAYRRLLDTYYTTEKPLPAELRSVFRLVLAATEAQREAVRVVLEEFFELTDEGWTNSRADAEIAEMRVKQQKQRDKANKRWQSRKQEPGIAPALPRHAEADSTASKGGADAMPPTPTPTPTPTPETHKCVDASPSAQPVTARGSRLDPAWTLPDDWKAWCQSERPDLNADHVADQFRDFWVAKPGKDGRKADWQATWRNWVRAQRTTTTPASTQKTTGRHAGFQTLNYREGVSEDGTFV